MNEMHQPQFFIHRNQNKSLIIKTVKNLDWEANNDSSDLSKQDQYSMEQLKAMQLVARMKDAADKAGAGFVGGFITPSGQRFMMSNVESDDVQHQAIEQQLKQYQEERQEIGSFFDSFQNKVRIVETEDGIQVRVEPQDD
jgi:hypothetical protein